MLQIDDTIISTDLIEKKFVCDLAVCRGACCRYGDSGAPLEEEETTVLSKILPDIRPFLRAEGISAIEEQGPFITDFEGELVTPLINNRECAYTVMEGEIYKCGIEKAYLAGATGFRKPLSCHLFPVRVTKYRTFRAVNYEKWSICRPGVARGERENVKLFSFLSEPLRRAFGQEWFERLKWSAGEYRKNKDK